jgi:tyrosyl-tRNA synthetase
MKILNNTVLRFLADEGIIKTMGEGRRLLANGAIKIDGVKVRTNVTIEDAETIQVGKRKITLTD